MPLVLGKCFPSLELNSFANTPAWFASVGLRPVFVVNLFTVSARELQTELLSTLLRPCTLLGLKYGDLGFSFSHHSMFVVALGVSISWLFIFCNFCNWFNKECLKLRE